MTPTPFRPLTPCDQRALTAALVALGIRVDRHPLTDAVADNRADEERRRAAGGVAGMLPASGVVVMGMVA